MLIKTQRDIRDEKSSFYPLHATNPSDTNSPPQINRGRLRHLSLPPYAVIHDMIATFIRPGRFTINLQSQGNRQTESQRGIDASCLLFCLSCFFPDALPPSIMLFSLRSCRMMFIKESRFSKHYLHLQWIENMCRNASHFPQFLDIFNCQ